MAQLTDDCFAFSGPADAGRGGRAHHCRAGRRRSPRVESVPLAAAALGRVLAEDVVAPIDLPPFDNSAVDGYAVRHADLDTTRETRLAVVDRVTAGHAARRAPVARRGGPHLHRRADAERRRHRVHAGGCSGRTSSPWWCRPGLKRGANRRIAGEDVRAGIRRAAGRAAARAAARRRSRPASGLTELAGAAPGPGRGVLDRRRNRRARHGSVPRRRCSTPTATCWPD